MQKIKKFTLAAVSVSAAFLLAACGSQQSSSSASKDKQVLKLSATAPLDTIDIRSTSVRRPATGRRGTFLKASTVWARTGSQPPA